MFVKIEKSGKYEVCLAYPPNNNRSSHVKVTILHAEGESLVTVNQREAAPAGHPLRSLGIYLFQSGQTAAVTVSNEGADGYVIIDAAQWLPAP